MRVKMENNETLPVVDLEEFINGSKDKRHEIASRVDSICFDIGFLIIKNHVKVDNKEKVFTLMEVSFTLLTTSLDTNVKCLDCVKRFFTCN